MKGEIGERLYPACDVLGITARDDQADVAASAFGEIGGKARDVGGAVFETGSIEPIRTRLRSVVKPRSRGNSR